MNIIFDFEKLGELLKNFYAISGVRYSLIDPDYNVIFASGDHTEYCEIINSTNEGHRRCVNCDTLYAKQLCPDSKSLAYRCHAGALEVVLPVVEEGQMIAYLFFGQMLSLEEPAQAQWEQAREHLLWFRDESVLQDAFYLLPRLSAETIAACTAILMACTSYIRLEGVVKTAVQTDLQRLHAYIEQNYTACITLDDAARTLNMSKTKICGLAAGQNTTFTKLLCKKRMDTAKDLLATTDAPIAQIAETVGIADYNYFTKLFRTSVGMTPRSYRKAAPHG